MIAKLKYYFLYAVFLVSLSVIKKFIEICMWFELDSTINSTIGKFTVTDNTVNALAGLHKELSK